MRLPVSRALSLTALALVTACGGAGVRPAELAAGPANGPAADYPVVVGDPFVIDGVTYTPRDSMNYDAVGLAAAGLEGGEAVTAAHRTLPLPSYAEVTSLGTGKTILVRIERRGPLNGKALVELSPGAAAQLGFAGEPGFAVRVRRVNPVEPERALLRSGQAAPARMDTPRSLLGVLMRKLEAQSGAVNPAPVAEPVATKEPALVAAPPPAKPVPQPAQGSFVVQIGVYGNPANVEAAVKKTGGVARQSGKLWAVRIGPFANESQAQGALAKARGAGYTDARIQRGN